MSDFSEDAISTITKIALISTIVFGYLWYRTAPQSTYETIEMDTVSTRRVFLILAAVSFCFFLASLYLWK